VHYTWKVAEKGFKFAFMMNKLETIISFEIFLKNRIIFFVKNHCEIQMCNILVCALYSIKYVKWLSGNKCSGLFCPTVSEDDKKLNKNATFGKFIKHFMSVTYGHSKIWCTIILSMHVKMHLLILQPL
jgi:hypothetical protein